MCSSDLGGLDEVCFNCGGYGWIVDQHPRSCKEFFRLCTGLEFERQPFFLNFTAVMFDLLQKYRVGIEGQYVVARYFVSGDYLGQGLPAALQHEGYIKRQPI